MLLYSGRFRLMPSRARYPVATYLWCSFRIQSSCFFGSVLFFVSSTLVLKTLKENMNRLSVSCSSIFIASLFFPSNFVVLDFFFVCLLFCRQLKISKSPPPRTPNDALTTTNNSNKKMCIWRVCAISLWVQSQMCTLLASCHKCYVNFSRITKSGTGLWCIR